MLKSPGLPADLVIVATSSDRGGAARFTPRPASEKDRGSIVVEAAFLIPVFMVLAFGIIDFGLALTNQNAVRNGAREGARSGVVAEFGSDASCPITGAGSPSQETKSLICLTKQRVGLDDAATRAKIDWPNEDKPGDPLVVCVDYPLDSVTGMFDPVLDGKSLRTRVEMRIEQLDAGLGEFAETLPDGRDWSWC